MLKGLQFRGAAQKTAFAALMLALGFMVGVHLLRGLNFGVTLWTTRDFARTLDLFRHFQVCGAEMASGYGMRLPGGAMYCLWAVPVLLTKSPVVLNMCLVAANLFSVYVLFRLLLRFWGPLGAAAGCNVYLVSMVTGRVMFQLWNPAAMPLFVVAAFYFVARVCEGEARYFKWAALMIALGMQMHMSVLLLVPAAVVAVLVFALSGTAGFAACGTLWNRIWAVLRDCFLPAFGLVVLAFLPYIIYECLHGFPNTRLLAFQDIVQGADIPFFFRLSQTVKSAALIFNGLGAARAEEAMAGLFAGGSLWRLWLFAADWFFVALAAVGAALTVLRGRGPGRRMGLFCFLLVFATLLYYSFFRWSLFSHVRYLFVLVPVLAWGAAAAAARIEFFLRGRAAAGFYALLVIVCVFQVAANPDMSRDWSCGYYLRSKGCLRMLGEALGWTLEDIAGRTRFLQSPDGGRTWVHDYDSPNLTDFELALRGIDFPGSGPLPGAVVLWDGAYYRDEPELLNDFAKKYLRRDFGDVEVLKVIPAGLDLIILYDRAVGGLAFTNMSNRYILLDEERVLLGCVRSLSPQSARKLERAGDFAVNVDSIVYLLLRFENIGGRVRIGLFSNQLRGTVCNYGFYSDGALLGPRIVWENLNTGTETETVIYDDRVGFDGVFAPLSADFGIEPGEYELRFRAGVRRLSDQFLARPLFGADEERREIDIALGRFAVPGK